MEKPHGMYVSPVFLLLVVAALSVLLTIIVMTRLQISASPAETPVNLAQASAPAQHLQLYYSTMHPWIVQDHPGTCPICGMELVRMSPKDQADYLANHPEFA